MTIWRITAAATALLLLAGCTANLGTGPAIDEEPDAGLPQNVAVFAANVTGTAVIQWSDGDQTHTETVDGTRKAEWRSDLDYSRYVTAMTIVPTGAGSKATCTITLTFGSDDPDGWSTFTDKTTGPGKAAICITTGEADEPELGNPPTITLTATSKLGKAQWRAQTEVGNKSKEKLTGTEQHQFATSGLVQMLVVAQQTDDKVGCDIRTDPVDDPNGTHLVSNTATGLGAIATCAATIAR